MTARVALMGLSGAVILIACLLPLLWPVGHLSLVMSPSKLAILTSADIWRLLAATLAISTAVLSLALAIGLPMAVIVTRTDAVGRGFALVVHAFPAFLPPLLPALGWFHIFGREGLLGTEMTAVLLFSYLGLVFILGLTFAPIVTALTALALWNADPALEDAARTVASPLRVTTRILLPGARPAIVLAGIIVIALTLSEVGVPLFLRSRTYAAAVFARLGGIDYAPEEAVLLTLPVVAIAMSLLLIERRLASRRSFAVLGLRSFRAAPMQLGRWRVGASLWCWLVALVSAAPLAVLAWRAGSAGFADLPLWINGSIRNSLLPATVAATVIALIAIIIGHAESRQDRFASLLDSVALLTFIMPAALLGIGLIALWNRPTTVWLYGTWLIIVLGYVGRYAIIGTRAFAVACAQAKPEIEDAASIFGARYLRRLTKIVIPLHRRALVGVWLLVMLFCLRDLETAVLYYPPGRDPLTVRIFTLEANGPESVVAALACVQIAITASLLLIALPFLLHRSRQ